MTSNLPRCIFFAQMPVNIIVSKYNVPALVPAGRSNFDVK